MYYGVTDGSPRKQSSAMNFIELSEKIGIPPASLPNWPTRLGIAGRKLVGHAEQVPQDISIDARQANQHGVTDVVVRT
jgi:hypothetical protein